MRELDYKFYLGESPRIVIAKLFRLVSENVEKGRSFGEHYAALPIKNFRNYK
jgi:hypothetical protein